MRTGLCGRRAVSSGSQSVKFWHACIVLCPVLLAGQETTFRATVPLVIAPTTVTDHRGRYINGLAREDFLVYSDRARQEIQVDVDVAYQPISLVIVVQANEGAAPALARVRKIGSMIEPLVIGEAGEAAVITFADQVRTILPFTSDADEVKQALAGIRAEGSPQSARMVDATAQAVYLLSKVPPNRRRVVLLIGETKDRGSESKLAGVIRGAQQANVLIYPLTFSAYATTFASKPSDVPTPANAGIDFLAMIIELVRLGKTNTADALARCTGGRRFFFVQQKGLEQAISRAGEELHCQYILSFTPSQPRDAFFHEILIQVRGRPDAIVRTRPGYWFPQE